MHRSRQAFTLLELLLVLALLGMMLAIAWPALHRSLGSQRLKRAAEAVQTRLARARTKAITSGEILSFRFQTQTGRFRIEQASQWNAALASAGGTNMPTAGGSAMPPMASSPSALPNSANSGNSGPAGGSSQIENVPPVNEELPEGVQFVSTDVSADSRASLASTNDSFTSISDAPWSQPILFFPDGTATSAKIVLQGERGRSLTVELRGLTGAARIGEIEASQELRR